MPALPLQPIRDIPSLDCFNLKHVYNGVQNDSCSLNDACIQPETSPCRMPLLFIQVNRTTVGGAYAGVSIVAEGPGRLFIIFRSSGLSLDTSFLPVAAPRCEGYFTL